MKSTTALRNRLEARLGQIAQRVGRIESDLRREHDRDWEEREIGRASCTERVYSDV